MTNYFGDAASVDTTVPSRPILEDDGMTEDPFINIQEGSSELFQNEPTAMPESDALGMGLDMGTVADLDMELTEQGSSQLLDALGLEEEGKNKIQGLIDSLSEQFKLLIDTRERSSTNDSAHALMIEKQIKMVQNLMQMMDNNLHRALMAKVQSEAVEVILSVNEVFSEIFDEVRDNLNSESIKKQMSFTGAKGKRVDIEMRNVAEVFENAVKFSNSPSSAGLEITRKEDLGGKIG